MLVFEVVNEITEQNTVNISKIVQSLMSKKEEPAMGVRTAPFTKPVKVPNWTKFLRLETYIKQIET